MMSILLGISYTFYLTYLIFENKIFKIKNKKIVLFFSVLAVLSIFSFVLTAFIGWCASLLSLYGTNIINSLSEHNIVLSESVLENTPFSESFTSTYTFYPILNLLNIPVSDIPTLFYFGFVLALLFIVPLCFSSNFCKSKSKSNRKDNHYEK